MKKAWSVLLAAVLCTGMFAGCAGTETASTGGASSQEVQSAEESKTEESAAEESQEGGETVDLSGTVSTNGSTSMEEVMMGLTEYFKEKYPNITVTYDPTGSGTGIQQATSGSCDIGLSSRSLKDEEKAKGLEETTLALDGIALVVNPENPVSDLDLETISKIYTGEISNWKDVGGNDSDIVLIGREAGSGTRDGFESITYTTDKCQYRQELTSTGDVIATVASNPNAIGYASLSAVKDSVKALKVAGVAPSEETVKDGSYVVQRPFVLVTVKDKALSENAKKFMEFITSKSANDIISGAGVVPAN